jgi:[protein-PII] uridylyltransferase
MNEAVATSGVPGLDPFVLDLREFHRSGLEKIRGKHLSGAGGLQIVEETTGLMDQVVVRAWRHALRTATELTGEDLAKNPPQVALIAVGGYGRAQLQPRSDVDILFLHKPHLSTTDTEAVKKTLQLLWDTGLEIGHSARTWSDCVRIANEDLDSRTALLENRYLAGNQALYEGFHKKYRRLLGRFGIQNFIRQKEAERQIRYRKQGRTVALQEPNIKESAGGLRDLHHAIWLGIAMYDISALPGIRRRGVIREPLYGNIVSAVDFILRIRNEIHLTHNTPSNRLTFEAQEAVAKAFGYTDLGVNLAEENLMRDYYTAASHLQKFADFMTIRCLRPKTIRRLIGSMRRRRIADGIWMQGGRLSVQNPETFFLSHPERIVKIFRTLQETGCAWDSDLLSEVSQTLSTMSPEDFSGSKESQAMIVGLLAKPGRVGPVMRAFAETGFMSVLIPEFNVIRFLPRRDLYHRYTVDEHSLISVEMLDAMAEEHEPESPVFPLEELNSRFPAARRRWRWWGTEPIKRCDEVEGEDGKAGDLDDIMTLRYHTQAGEDSIAKIKEVYARVERPELLYLATFLHDIGKGRGGDHNVKGAAIACEVCHRLGLNAPDTDLVILLVEQHLEFAKIAFRFDTSDFTTVQEFASWCDSQVKLDYLFLLTLADIWAVNPELLTEWKLSMLHHFYAQVRSFLDDRQKAELQQIQEREKAYKEFMATLPRDIQESEADKHLARMPADYLTQHEPDLLHFHLRLLREYTGDRPIVGCRQMMMNVLQVVTVQTSRIGNFMRVARSLSSLNLSILEARIFMRDDGVAVNTLWAVPLEGESVRQETMNEIVARTVSSLQDKWEKEWDPQRRRFQDRGRFRFTPRVEVDNKVSSRFTVVEVHCADAIGVLVEITSALAKYGLDIHIARIHTEERRVMDTFYVLDANRQKFDNLQKINWLRTSLIKALEAVV